jgi:5'-3' exonuclease
MAQMCDTEEQISYPHFKFFIALCVFVFKVYKWLSERYPLINQLANSDIKPEFGQSDEAKLLKEDLEREGRCALVCQRAGLLRQQVEGAQDGVRIHVSCRWHAIMILYEDVQNMKSEGLLPTLFLLLSDNMYLDMNGIIHVRHHAHTAQRWCASLYSELCADGLSWLF